MFALIFLLAIGRAQAQTLPAAPSLPADNSGAAAAGAQSDALLAQGDVLGARQALQSALDANPHQYALVLRYAYLSYLLKDFKTAETYYAQAAALGAAEAAPMEGLFYTALGANDPKWTTYAQSLLKLNPAHRQANLSLASQEFSRHEYRESAEHYSRLLAAAPEDADALLGLAWCEYYMGDSWKAKDHFKQVLAMFPANASAQQGLKLSPLQTTYLTVGSSYAGLNYNNIASKTGGSSVSVPITVAYKDKWTGTLTYSRTIINFPGAPPPPVHPDPRCPIMYICPPCPFPCSGGPPPCYYGPDPACPFAPSVTQGSSGSQTKQDEVVCSGSYNLTPKISLIGAFDNISVNDPATDTGKVYTGGFNYGTALWAGSPRFLSLGGYYSYSSYPSFNIAQISPHVGIGTTGIYADLSMSNIHDQGTNEQVNSYKASLALGPFNNLTLTASGYAGEKRLPVEEWGTVIFNNQDLYRGGWKAGLSWAYSGLSIFGLYGQDNVRALDVGSKIIDYTSITTVGGVSYRFGYQQEQGGDKE